MHGGEPSETSLDFDLNLAPIIDCLTVLIAFLLISTSYVSLYILDASVAAVEVTQNTDDQQDDKPVGITLHLEIKKDGILQLQISGASEQAIAYKPGAPQLIELNKKLGELKSKWKDTKSITLSAENTVPYKEIVRIFDSLRTVFPKIGPDKSTILLGGF